MLSVQYFLQFGRIGRYFDEFVAEFEGSGVKCSATTLQRKYMAQCLESSS